MKSVDVPNELTYVGVFLTLRCNLSCSYCLNHYAEFSHRKELTPRQWIEGLNRLKIPRGKMVPITLQGGEPSVYRGLVDIICGLKNEFYIDLLTNLSFDLDKFIERISPGRLQRNVPYASIRVSYHPEQMNFEILLRRVLALQGAGYDIGLFMVDHPDIDIEKYKRHALLAGVDFRTKQFLGSHKGTNYGTYKYPWALQKKKQPIQCRSSELLIAPSGDIHKCHSDLYSGVDPIGNILDKNLKIEMKWRKCIGNACNPCDIKLKNSRFQIFGSCSVEIKKHE